MTDSPPPIIEQYRLAPQDERWFDEASISVNEKLTDGLLRDGALDLPAWTRLQQTVVTLENEAISSTNRRRKASMYYELFRIFETELNDEDRALLSLQRAFHTDRKHLPTLWAGRRVFGRVGRWSMVVRLLEAEVRASSVASRKARALKEMGEVYLAHFGRPEEALHCFEAAYKIEEGAGIAAIDCLHASRLFEQRSASDGVLRSLGHDSRDRMWTHGTCALAVGDLVREHAYQQALDVVSRWPRTVTQHLAVRYLLLVAHRALGQWGEAASIMLASLKQMPDAEQRSGVLRSLAYWRPAARETAVDAVELLETVVALVPRSADGWFQLGCSQDRRGEVREAVGAFCEAFELQACETIERLCVFQVGWRACEIADRSAESRAMVEKWAVVGSANPLTEHFVDGCLLEEQAWNELLERYRHRFAEGEASERGWFAWLAGLLCRFRLDAPDEAQRWFAIAYEAYPHSRLAQLSHFGARASDVGTEEASELLELYAKLSEWATNHDLASGEPPLTVLGDGQTVVDRLLRTLAAPLIAGDLIAWWASLKQYALKFGSDEIVQRLEGFGLYEPALRDAWPTIKRRQAGLAGANQARGCWLGWCAFDYWRMGDEHLPKALELLEEALILAPDSPELLLLGMDIASDAEHYDMKAEWGLALAQSLADPVWKAELLAAAAQNHLNAEDRAGLAVDLLLRAIEQHSGCILARTSLFDLGRCASDFDRASELLRPLARSAYHPLEAEVVWLDLAEKARRHGAIDEAISAAEEAGERTGASLHHLFVLERVGLAARSPEALVGVYDRLLGRVRDPRITSELLLKKGRVLERTGDFFEAAQTIRLCLKASSDTVAAVEWFARWVNETGDLELLAEILGPLMRGREDDGERAELLMEAGRALRLADRVPESQQCFEAVLKMNGERLIPIRYLRLSAMESGDMVGSAELFHREAQAAIDDENRATLFGEAGKAFLALKRDKDALDAYCSALNSKPGQVELINRIRSLCERRGDWETWVEVLQTIPCANLSEAEGVALEAATLFRDRLKSTPRAIEVLEKVVHTGEQPSVKVIQMLADLYTDDGRWVEAEGMYRQLRTISLDEALRRSVSFRLASICADHLGNPQAAIEILKEILADDPSNTAALDRLAHLELVENNGLGARLALTRAINAATSPEERASFRRRLAKLDLTENRPEIALAGLRLAVEDAADSATTYEVMADVFEKTDDMDEQAAALRSAIELTRSPKERQRLSSKLQGREPPSVPPADSTKVNVGDPELHQREPVEPLHDPLCPDQLARQCASFRRRGLVARTRTLDDFMLGFRYETAGSSQPPGEMSHIQYPPDGIVYPQVWSALNGELLQALLELVDLFPARFRQAPLGGTLSDVDSHSVRARPWYRSGAIRALPLPLSVCFEDRSAVTISRHLLTMPTAEMRFWAGCHDVFLATRTEFLTRWRSDDLVLFLRALGRITRLLSDSEVDSQCINLANGLNAALAPLAADPQLLRPLGKLLEVQEKMPEFERRVWRCAIRHGFLVSGSPASTARTLSAMRVGGSEEEQNTWSARLGDLSRWICNGGADAFLEEVAE
ncbi:MAG: tetratricopeptide repeat protein [Myxococcota bacterium]|nr:tetratricopeptide repeat protein [Myxococcota bacterium]